MNCVSPITLKVTGASLRRTNTVPCGKCVPCLERRRNDWSIRLSEQLKHSSSAIFITLTYNDESIPYHPDTGSLTLVKKDLQLFLKRLRNFLSQGVNTTNFFGKSVKMAKTDVKIKYFGQGEYGSSKNRPHYHMLIFNLPSNCEFLIERAWEKGFVHFGEVNMATIHYCTKYMITKYDDYFDGVQAPFALMSKGLGVQYAERNGDYHRKNAISTFTQIGGVKYPLPRYWKDKIFDDVQKKEISAKSNSYTQRRESTEYQNIRNDVRTESEYYLVKHERTKSYLASREKMLNKSKKL